MSEYWSSPKNHIALSKRCLEVEEVLSEKDKDFLLTIRKITWLSDKQRGWLRDIARRCEAFRDG